MVRTPNEFLINAIAERQKKEYGSGLQLSRLCASHQSKLNSYFARDTFRRDSGGKHSRQNAKRSCSFICSRSWRVCGRKSTSRGIESPFSSPPTSFIIFFVTTLTRGKLLGNAITSAATRPCAPFSTISSRHPFASRGWLDSFSRTL